MAAGDDSTNTVVTGLAVGRIAEEVVEVVLALKGSVVHWLAAGSGLAAGLGLAAVFD